MQVLSLSVALPVYGVRLSQQPETASSYLHLVCHKRRMDVSQHPVIVAYGFRVEELGG